jgi:hypothetical protein
MESTCHQGTVTLHHVCGRQDGPILFPQHQARQAPPTTPQPPPAASSGRTPSPSCARALRRRGKAPGASSRSGAQQQRTQSGLAERMMQKCGQTWPRICLPAARFGAPALDPAISAFSAQPRPLTPCHHPGWTGGTASATFFCRRCEIKTATKTRTKTAPKCKVKTRNLFLTLYLVQFQTVRHQIDWSYSLMVKEPASEAIIIGSIPGRDTISVIEDSSIFL